MRRGAYENGLAYLLSLIEGHPDDRELVTNAAKLAGKLGNIKAATECFHLLLARSDLTADDRFNTAYALKGLGDYEGAVFAYQQSIDQDMRAPEEAHLNMGVIYADCLFDIEAAKTAFKTAIELNPRLLSAYTNLGNLYEETADFKSAQRVYENALSADPQAYEALARLANSHDFETADHPVLKKIEAATRSTTATDFDKECLFFALGTALDSLRDYDGAFTAYEAANTHGLAYGQPYDRTELEVRMNNLITRFPETAFSVRPEEKADAKDYPAPIFICGMFRSGSTLAEQVLGAHPDITPKGELDFFAHLKVSEGLITQGKASLEKLEAYRVAYRQHAATSLIKTPFFTDKRPDNLLHLGLIKTLFPAAKIIHTIREPIDNYLSIYFTQFSDGQNYARKLNDIEHYHSEQKRLMAHWHSIFGDDIFTLPYDALIREPRRTTRQVLDFLNLPWDEACLSFHNQRNRVKTASYKQIRRPLYTTSSGRAKNYAKALKQQLLD